MNFRTYFFLFLFGLAVPVIIAQFQPIPGYLDSDYYYAGGIQLATGKGFTEPYLWNFLDGTTSLPHPSHSYWMPLASIVSALGMWLTGQTTFASARLFFFLIAAFVPPLTAALAYTFSQKNDIAIASGMLAIFSVYHAPFVGVTDNFSLFMLFGGLYFIIATQLMQDPTRMRNWLLLGVLSGLMALSRSDGLLWLPLTFLFALWRAKKISSFLPHPSPFIFALLGFLLIMSPWYIRNLNLYGTPMAPGGSRALWLENYDQTFVYPPTLITKESFLAQGWDKILDDRLWAMNMNLQSGFAAHGGIILFPFIVAGIIYYRKDDRVKLVTIAWLILFFVMTFLFPFAGARGAFFHAGAALQPMWWTLAPLGLESILVSLRKRGWGNDQNRVVFRSALVMVAMILTVYVVYLRVFTLGWGEIDADYKAVDQFLVEHGIEEQDIVMARNAPGYYLNTGRSAISIPYGGETALLQAAQEFEAYYLVLEPEAVLDPIKDLFQNPDSRNKFVYLGDVDGARIYKLETK
ncbi:MAG: glycosyltransferase family 39 protein [Anaerolineales bacterium]|nr:glycosyltransferase family 39 protein [Anaerolineales bacterium]